jgi:hypothetical protein
VTVQDDFTRRLTTALSKGAEEVDAATSHRLALMRRHALTSNNVAHMGSPVLTWVHRHSWAGAFLVLVLLFSSWWFTQKTPHVYSPETDILLLTGDLPPNAYADKTLTQWLESRTSF